MAEAEARKQKLTTEYLAQHTIVAAPDGLPARAVIEHGKVKVTGEMSEQENRDYVKRLIAQARKAPVNPKTGKRELLIFIHGGLNVPTSAIEHSGVLSTYIEKEKRYYPIFINWDSGPFSTLGEHLFQVRQGETKPLLAKATSSVVLGADLIRGMARAPLVWTSLSLSANEQPGGFMPPSHRMLSSQQVLLHPVQPGVGPEVSPKSPLVTHYRTKADRAVQKAHDLTFVPKMVTSTLIDALGCGAWDMMVRRSQLLFQAPTSRAAMPAEVRTKSDRIASIVKQRQEETAEGRSEIEKLSHELQVKDPSSGLEPAVHLSRSRPGAVEQFLAQLKAELGEEARGYSITLIGHSMGAIVANEMISRHSELPFDRIVYMAAACSIKECTTSVGSYLLKNRYSHFYNLTLHPVSEVAETEPAIGPEDRWYQAAWKFPASLMVPRGSLLVWLDEFFTNPTTEQDRRMGKWRACIRSANAFPKEVQSRVHLKMFTRGPVDDPQTHGAFSSEGIGFWRPEFWEPTIVTPYTPYGQPRPL